MYCGYMGMKLEQFNNNLINIKKNPRIVSRVNRHTHIHRT